MANGRLQFMRPRYDESSLIEKEAYGIACDKSVRLGANEMRFTLPVTRRAQPPPSSHT
jgi:hypothetical protein